ncbi:MAG: hypothetical protein K2X60_03405 [Xanthobacteraceae bacterium]|nr:hypothetical protein [Xanthobacteraceae bacterium]
MLPPQPSTALALLTLALAVPAGLILRSLEADLVLPAFSVLLFCGAALAVLFASFMRSARNLQGLTLWDIAGGLAITGCAASALSEPDQVTQLFEHLFERRSDMQQE